jgi:hypothetical protein
MEPSGHHRLSALLDSAGFACARRILLVHLQTLDDMFWAHIPEVAHSLAAEGI